MTTIKLAGRAARHRPPLLEPEVLQRKILARFKLKSQLVDGAIRIEKLRAHELVRDLIDAFGEEIESVSFGKPTLEDVFVHLTGHQFFAHTPETE